MFSRHLENIVLLLAHDLQTFKLSNFDDLKDVFKNLVEGLLVYGRR